MIRSKRYGLFESDIQAVLAVIKKNQRIHKAVLFGSRAKGTFHEGSDIDIAMKGDALKTDDVISLLIEIDALFLPYKFDLVIYDRIKEKNLIEYIDRAGLTLYERI